MFYCNRDDWATSDLCLAAAEAMAAAAPQPPAAAATRSEDVAANVHCGRVKLGLQRRALRPHRAPPGLPAPFLHCRCAAALAQSLGRASGRACAMPC